MEDMKEKLTTCPYNKAHRIRQSRLHEHLTKCRKNHLDAPMSTCTYNNRHVVPTPELQYHLNICADRRVTEAIAMDVFKACSTLYPVPKDTQVDNSWDDDIIPGKTYDPTEYLENNEIIRRMDVAPPSVRRNFRMQERQKMAKILEQKKNAQTNDPQHSSTLPPVEMPPQQVKENAPPEVQQLINRIKNDPKKAFVPKH